MKKFFKLGCFGFIGLIVLFIIISAVSSGGDSDTTSNEPKEEVTKEKKKDAPKKEKIYGIGDVVKVGDLEYTIKEKKEADQVGPSVLPEKASGKFVVLEVSLKNKGNEAVTADASFFKLKRGEKVYEADSAASISANQGEDGQIENSFFLQEVNPDSEAAGKVVFDVAPEVAEASDLKVQVQTGVFGTETESITLK
ncbi:DUF4352 domain-containing protein [Peribacillus frigoritolerans]|uniref:DUF4352 domain-containing protein n=1 Tax=Peribacillus frigoritolerans TaxID=450367 RepID=UPI001C9A447C|nr:DUF4352 domain-containing protein [Peribacillus frigoritolerans]MED3710049.1 DUF4352 domain-containing protein [Peribacillus frigoritolerans]MED3889747.1 DUF4352 domain-containing protein [Peribacillus frigoritolerans]